MAEARRRLLAVTALGASIAAVSLLVRDAVTVGDADGPEPVRACRTVAVEDLRGRVTCSTPSARLTIADEATALLVGGTQARVLRSRLVGRTVLVRMRLRSPAELRRARVGDGQVYLNVAGRRFEHAPLVGGRRTGSTTTFSLRFRLPRTAARELRREQARGDLGVVPFEHLGQERPPRLGVIRLDLP